MIPLSIPNITKAEEKSVQEWLGKGWVSTAGPVLREFEEKVNQFCGAKYAVATNSGTSALHLALIVTGVKPGDLVLVPNFTFIASVNVICYVGAEPILVDANPKDWQADIELLRSFLSTKTEQKTGECFHKESGKRIAALLPVHVLGQIGQIEEWAKLAEEFGISLIEDAAESMGSRRVGQHAGTFGKVGCLSFNGNKIMTTGSGGMLLTSDKKMADMARHLATQARIHQEEYLHDSVGYNYRMDSMAAALGLAQIERIPAFIARKNEINSYYKKELQDIEKLSFMPEPSAPGQTNYWMFPILSSDSRPLQDYLYHHGIQTRKLWIPANRQPMFRNCEYLSSGDHSFSIYENSLCLPCSTGISETELQKVVAAIKAFF